MKTLRVFLVRSTIDDTVIEACFDLETAEALAAERLGDADEGVAVESHVLRLGRPLATLDAQRIRPNAKFRRWRREAAWGGAR